MPIDYKRIGSVLIRGLCAKVPVVGDFGSAALDEMERAKLSNAVNRQDDRIDLQDAEIEQLRQKYDELKSKYSLLEEVTLAFRDYIAIQSANYGGIQERVSALEKCVRNAKAYQTLSETDSLTYLALLHTAEADVSEALKNLAEADTGIQEKLSVVGDALKDFQDYEATMLDSYRHAKGKQSSPNPPYLEVKTEDVLRDDFADLSAPKPTIESVDEPYYEKVKRLPESERQALIRLGRLLYDSDDEDYADHEYDEEEVPFDDYQALDEMKDHIRIQDGHICRLILTDIDSIGIVDNYWSSLSGHERYKQLYESLRDFPYLTYLDLSENDLSHFPLIIQLRNLEYLDLNSTGSVDISALKSFSKLKYLDLSCSDVQDIGPLEGMKSLRTLKLDGLCLDLSVLPTLSGLEVLSLEEWEGDLDEQFAPLLQCPQIKELIFQCIFVTDLSFLSNCRSLNQLVVLDFYGTDISGLSNLTGLRSLYLEAQREAAFREGESIDEFRLRCEYTEDRRSLFEPKRIDLSPLASLELLHELDICELDVSDLTCLMGLRSLKRVSFGDCTFHDNALAQLAVLKDKGVEVGISPSNDSDA